MKILIAGSTGLIGNALYESLSEKSHKVVRLLRTSSNFSDEGLDPAPTYLTWNPPEKSIDLMNEEFDVVINLCGEPVAAKRWNEEQKRLLYQSRIVSTRLLTGAIAKMKTPPKIFINASAVGVYGERGDVLLTEAAAGTHTMGDMHVFGDKGIPTTSAGLFMRELCEDWENVAKLTTKTAEATFVLRIGLVLDQNARIMKLLKPLFNFGLGGWLGKSQSWMGWISLDDVIGAIEFILENSKDILNQNLVTDNSVIGNSVIGNAADSEDNKEYENSSKEKQADPKKYRAINLTAPNPAQAKEFAKAMGKAMKRPALLKVPKLGPQTLLGKELVTALLQSQRVVPKELIDAGYEFKHPDIGSAFRDILRKK